MLFLTAKSAGVQIKKSFEMLFFTDLHMISQKKENKEDCVIHGKRAIAMFDIRDLKSAYANRTCLICPISLIKLLPYLRRHFQWRVLSTQ
jgi:hypothetical protein